MASGDCARSMDAFAFSPNASMLLKWWIPKHREVRWRRRKCSSAQRFARARQEAIADRVPRRHQARRVSCRGIRACSAKSSACGRTGWKSSFREGCARCRPHRDSCGFLQCSPRPRRRHGLGFPQIRASRPATANSSLATPATSRSAPCRAGRRLVRRPAGPRATRDPDDRSRNGASRSGLHPTTRKARRRA